MKKNKEKVISIIGHFGGNENFLDGQTVKTKTLYEELKQNTNWKIIKVDTYYKNKNPIKLICDTIKCILKTKQIIILLSGNGMKFYFPLLSFLANKFHYKIYHDVIGGNLDQYVIRFPKYKKYLNSFAVNWVETNSLKEKLNKCEINNCDVIPNFKNLKIEKSKKYITDEKTTFNFCTFSRVMEDKGITEAAEAINCLNKKYQKKFSLYLDIYGPVEKEYKNQLNKLIKNENISYKGIVPYDETTQILKNYDVLLFPTKWKGEGFPGTIIDAFSAGLPVIASDWNSNSEIVKNKKNGLIFPTKDNPTLMSAVETLILNVDLIKKMEKNCLKDAKKYQPDKYVNSIIKMISFDNKL